MTDAPVPLRVAVVGAGPAGIYVAAALRDAPEPGVDVDIFDRLPTPFGLLRYGVAPDHLKMKALTRTLQRVLDDERVRFFGNVGVGTDVTVEELLADYHAVVYSSGAALDRRLGIPGEDLPGCYSAAAFVAWYCGHPDAADDPVRLDASSVAVIGLGNVALDVARVLLRDPEELVPTDVPDSVLAALRASAVTEVHIVGRRGPREAKFTHKELRELGELAGVDVSVAPAAQLDLTAHPDDPTQVARNVAIFEDWSRRTPSGGRRRLVVHFFATPVAIEGDARVQSLVVQQGEVTARIPVGMVFRSLGSLGIALPGVPMDEAAGTIPTQDHRVVGGAVPVGEYACGWIKRGATGVIGTNRSDATETARALLGDADRLRDRPVRPGTVLTMLRERGTSVVTLDGWSAIDAAEAALGHGRGSPRVKLARWDELLAAAGGSARGSG